MNQPKISKLFKLRNWLKLPEAAKYLSLVCGEEITEADLFRFALDRKITISVHFINGTQAKPGKKVDYRDRNDKDVIFQEVNENWIKQENRVITIDGIWDLPMIGDERRLIEHKYQQLTGGPKVEIIPWDGYYVSRFDNEFYELQDLDEENLFYEGTEGYSDKFITPTEFTKDSVFVLRTDVLREFEQNISEIELEIGSDCSHGTDESNISETERNKLLKQISGLALVLAEKNNRYKKGETPSANAIAESVIEIIEALPDSNKYGLGKTSIRDSISNGLKLLNK